MKNSRTTLVFFFLVIPFNFMSFAQNQKGDRVILAVNQNLKSAKFHVYSPPFLAKAIYKDTIEAKNLYPEELMSSILSEKNASWTKYNEPRNTTPKGKVHYDWVKTMNKEKNYFRLQHKFQWDENGQEGAIHCSHFIKKELGFATL